MNVVSRGVRNAFRNVIRACSLMVILGISIGLALSMLIAYQAVGKKIETVKSSIGNTVSISPAGVRGFEGGGSALTESELASVKKLAHVSSVTESLSDRLTTSNTNLQSAVDAGSLGQRFAGNNGQSFSARSGDGAPSGGQNGSATSAGSSSNSSGSSVTTSFTPPVTVVGTTTPMELSSSAQGGGSFALKSGKVFSASSADNVALVGSSLATKNNLKVGSTFTAYGSTVTVVGIFDAGNTFSNNQVIMPLKTIQTLSDQAGAVTSATIHVDSITNVASVTTAATKALGSKADVTNDVASAESSVAPLESIRTISLYSLIGAVVAGAVIILLTMIMIVRERRREIGVLKAIGASNLVVMGQFMVEAVTLTLFGAVIGIAFGFLAGSPITRLLVNNSTASGTTRTAGGPGGMRDGALRGLRDNVTNVHAAVGWEIILYGLGAAVVIAVVGSALASFFIAKIRPAEVMRAE